MNRIARGRITRTLSSLLLCTVAVTGLATTLDATPAFAGSNGQQIEFDNYGCGVGNLGHVSITGYNQNNHWVTWSGNVDSSVFVAGWWWYGNVTIRWGNHVTYAFVPRSNDTSYQFWANTVRVSCMGSWKWGQSTLRSGSGSNVSCVDFSSGNWGGSYTQYTVFQGYYGITTNGAISPSGYGIAYAGTTPAVVTRRYSYMQCD